jgi:hypothetical protein
MCVYWEDGGKKSGRKNISAGLFFFFFSVLITEQSARVMAEDDSFSQPTRQPNSYTEGGGKAAIERERE